MQLLQTRARGNKLHVEEVLAVCVHYVTFKVAREATQGMPTQVMTTTRRIRTSSLVARSQVLPFKIPTILVIR
jgi:hypothetical protein